MLPVVFILGTALANPSASELIAQYNSRPLGQPGRRHVNVELRDGLVVVRTYSIANIWTRAAGEVRSIFYLDAPAGLHGTRYLQVENPGHNPELAVYLCLPTANDRVLRVGDHLLGEGLLGSDFSYEDVRFLLPITGCSYLFLGSARVGSNDVWKLSADCRGGRGWKRAVLYLTKDRPFLAGSDLFASLESAAPFKAMRVLDYSDKGPIRTATRMVMTRPDASSTTITLEDFRAATPSIREMLFTPERLKGSGADWISGLAWR
jgi:hypothetical protein